METISRLSVPFSPFLFSSNSNSHLWNKYNFFHFSFLFFLFLSSYFSRHRNLKLWRYYYRREQCPIYLLIVTIPQILFVNCTNFLLFRMLQLIFQSWLAIFVFSMYFPVFLPFSSIQRGKILQPTCLVELYRAESNCVSSIRGQPICLA